MLDSGLQEALTSEHPCGEDLEDTQLLASFDAYRLFGQAAPLSPETDWHEIRDRSLEALATSKDFRLLAHCACAIVRIEGLTGFAQALGIAAQWLDSWWTEVFPRVDEDAILRRNALNGFADRMAIVDAVRRAPLLVHRQLGTFSIRDIEIATAQIPAPQEEASPPDATQLAALLAASSPEELTAVHGTLEDILRNLKAIEATMRERGGSEAAPDFAILAAPLARTSRLVAEHLQTRAPAQANASSGGPEGQPGDQAGGGGAIATGGIRTRGDATRALDAVAHFFRTNEPSSPIPLLIERTKRLVDKDFLQVLAELAPDALDQAKAASGVRDE
jgi:type VI secretion system protein ImpA